MRARRAARTPIRTALFSGGFLLFAVLVHALFELQVIVTEEPLLLWADVVVFIWTLVAVAIVAVKARATLAQRTGRPFEVRLEAEKHLAGVVWVAVLSVVPLWAARLF